MRLLPTRPLFVFVALCFAASAVAACSWSPQGATNPQVSPPSCAVPQCIVLQATLKLVALLPVDGIAVNTGVAGSGEVLVATRTNPFSGHILPHAGIDNSYFYIKFTAHNGSATLTYIPGFKLH